MMSITERQRNKLHNRAHEVFGVEEGDSLMELLPPLGWADVARTSDVVALRSDLDQHAVSIRQEIALAEARLQEQMHKDMREVYQAMSRMTRTMTVSMIGTVVASAGFAFTAGVAL